MVSTEYSEAATEVLAILNNTESELANKISKKFINFLKDNSSKTYNPQFDTAQPIKELKLKPKTEALLGIIYLNYWANDEEKKAFLKKTKENETKYQEEIREKFNPDNMFMKRRSVANEKRDDMPLQ